MGRGLWYGSFDVIYGPFLTPFQLSAAPHAPCNMLCQVRIYTDRVVVGGWDPMFTPDSSTPSGLYPADLTDPVPAHVGDGAVR